MSRSLFPLLSASRCDELIRLARIRRATRPNLAAWASAHINLSRTQSEQSLRAPGELTKDAAPQNTEAK
jgi:hypothetical protein